MAVALCALEARITVESTDGTTTVGIDDFYREPGERPDLDTTLPLGAIITAVDVPALAFATRSAYRKARDRRSFAFGLVTVAIAVEVEDGMIRDVRIALGGVAHRPWRARIAEDALRGRPATPDRFEAAIDAELALARPTEENAFKVTLVRRLVVGTLAELVQETRIGETAE
jgi:xanthine dehydrogenase YagS FAD-binding subunit